MKLNKQTLRRWAINRSPAILPVLATVTVALTVAYYAADQVSGQPSPTGWVKYLSWSRHVPEWLTKGLLMVLLAGSLAFVACQISLKYRVSANVASVAGVATTATLIWATQLCDQTGGVIVGLAIAGVILAGAVGVRALKERGLRKSREDWWSNSASGQTPIGTVQFAQISVALYMGTIALMAIANAVPAESRWAVLAFSGIGITAASAISEQGRLKNFLAVIGSGISTAGVVRRNGPCPRHGQWRYDGCDGVAGRRLGDLCSIHRDGAAMAPLGTYPDCTDVGRRNGILRHSCSNRGACDPNFHRV